MTLISGTMIFLVGTAVGAAIAAIALARHRPRQWHRSKGIAYMTQIQNGVIKKQILLSVRCPFCEGRFCIAEDGEIHRN